MVSLKESATRICIVNGKHDVNFIFDHITLPLTQKIAITAIFDHNPEQVQMLDSRYRNIIYDAVKIILIDADDIAIYNEGSIIIDEIKPMVDNTKYRETEAISKISEPSEGEITGCQSLGYLKSLLFAIRKRLFAKTQKDH